MMKYLTMLSMVAFPTVVLQILGRVHALLGKEGTALLA